MEQWFGAGLRTSMAVEVEEIVHGSGQGHRKCYYDEEGKDVRLSVPGVRWADLRTIRRGILESLRSSCQEAFDKIYEQILDGRRYVHVHADVGYFYMYMARVHERDIQYMQFCMHECV